MSEPAEPRQREVHSLLAAVTDAVAALLAADPAAVADGDLAADLVGLAAVSGLVDVALARRLSVFGARGLHAREGASNANCWLAVRSEMAGGRLHTLRRSGDQLVGCPAVLAAYESGVVGSAKAEMLLRARDGLEALFAEHEAELVAHVAPLSVAQARVAIETWRRHALDVVDRAGDRDPSTDEDRTRAHLSKTFGGRFRLDADLDAEAGQRLANHLAGDRDGRFRDGTWSADDGLSSVQRDAISLMDLVDRGAQQRSHHGGPRPSIHLNWDARDLLGEVAPDVADMVAQRCNLDDGTAVPRPLAERLLCRADVTELLVYFGTDGTRHPLGVVHHRRAPTRRERHALHERDRGCVFPGCAAPVGRTDAHHTVPYEIGRRTKLDELVLLCRYHHHAVHEGGFTLTRVDGTVEVTAPDGTPLTVVPHGHKILPPAPPPPTPPPEQDDVGPPPGPDQPDRPAA